jgi:tetratricopeptide (TPR) repeat protein
VTAANAPFIAEICYRLDGLPLAIELAAARSKIFAPQAILSRLDRRLTTLTGGARDLPARHQTLRGAIDWSYNLLDAAEQELFARLGVFVGGWTVEAAAAVLAADGDVLIDALDGLASLLDKSLLRQAEGPGGEPRFVMLETLREYALERLEAGGAAEAVRRAHATFYLALAEEAEPKLHGQGQLEALRRLEADHDNLRAALSWSLAHDDPGTALRLAGALAHFWLIHQHEREGCHWLEAALARAGRRAELARSAWRARALVGLGRLLEFEDQGAAETSSEEALAIYRELGDRAGMGYALYMLAAFPFFRSDYVASHALYQESLAHYQAEEDGWGIGMCLHCMAHLAHYQGDYPTARQLFQQSVALLRESGDLFNLTHPAHDLAIETWVCGDATRARELDEENLATFRALQAKGQISWVLDNLVDIALYQGEYSRARALTEEALAIRRELDSTALVCELERLGRLACLQGDLATGRSYYEQALQQAQAHNWTSDIARLEARLGRIAYYEGNLERAAALLQRSLPVFATGEAVLDLPYVLVEAGDVARVRGELEQAADYYRQSLTALAQREAVVGVAEPLEGLAKIAVAQGLPDRAARLLGAASALRERIAAPVAPVNRAEYEQSLAAARAVLDETAFDAAWAAGQALPLDQAIAEAMAGADHQGQGQPEEHIQVNE